MKWIHQVPICSQSGALRNAWRCWWIWTQVRNQMSGQMRRVEAGPKRYTDIPHCFCWKVNFATTTSIKGLFWWAAKIHTSATEDQPHCHWPVQLRSSLLDWWTNTRDVYQVESCPSASCRHCSNTKTLWWEIGIVQEFALVQFMMIHVAATH